MNLDSHKLMYHPDRVYEWMCMQKTFPIYAEISLTSACNHRCIFCAPSFFLNYKPHYLDTEVLKETLVNMSFHGTKAVMYGGEGEPLLHKDVSEIINYTKLAGLDVALTTNGVLMDKHFLQNTLPDMSWIKISVDADTDSIYEHIHRCNKGDLDKVFNNLENAVQLKKDNKLDCTIGTQAILLQENVDDISSLIVDMKEIGVDYLVVKPLSKHPSGECKDLDYIVTDKDIRDKFDMWRYHSTDDFKVIIRDEAFFNLEQEKPYDKCYAQDFMAYIDSLGGVHSCINFIGQLDYEYGNIYKDSFIDIWNNKPFIEPNLEECRTICRMDNVNRYLWKLKNPVEHVNFI